MISDSLLVIVPNSKLMRIMLRCNNDDNEQVFGSITKPLIEKMLFRRMKQCSGDSEPASLEDIHLMFLERENATPTGQGNQGPNPMRSSLSLLIRHPTSTVHYFWRQFDDRFMRPVFGGRGFVPILPGSPTSPPDEAV